MGVWAWRPAFLHPYSHTTTLPPMARAVDRAAPAARRLAYRVPRGNTHLPPEESPGGRANLRQVSSPYQPHPYLRSKPDPMRPATRNFGANCLAVCLVLGMSACISAGAQ